MRNYEERLASLPMTRDGRCQGCRVPMVRSGVFFDCPKCGRAMHEDELSDQQRRLF